MIHWHIITGEYPPQVGGVSDYTRAVAVGLAAVGDQVHIWAAPCAQEDNCDSGITVHRLPDRFGWRSLRALTHGLADGPKGRRILVQYVPHSFGWKAMNLPFCIWLFTQASGGVWIICHEVFVQMRRGASFKNNFIGAVTRMMSFLVARSAQRIWVTIPSWRSLIGQMARPGTPIECLPVPSTIEVFIDLERVQSIRRRVSSKKPFLLGHFGTYRQDSVSILMDLFPPLMSACACHLLLLGQNSGEFRDRLVDRYPQMKELVSASGTLMPKDLSVHLAACDLMVQPYPDGVSGRRTSMMACLAHGIPVVTNLGPLSEDYWARSGAVRIVNAITANSFADTVYSLLIDAAARQSLRSNAGRLYEERFSVSRIICALRGAAVATDGRLPGALACMSPAGQQ
jgi:glycosyltransferase involved in cell wall biosynthesis